jgi:hypothetical protein
MRTRERKGEGLVLREIDKKKKQVFVDSKCNQTKRK